ncbi:centrosomal protein POC5 [Pelomyxa schiedti]|nr:centrosomal protein POC5 [Pelomyxa schiedti]
MKQQIMKDILAFKNHMVEIQKRDLEAGLADLTEANRERDARINQLEGTIRALEGEREQDKAVISTLASGFSQRALQLNALHMVHRCYAVWRNAARQRVFHQQCTLAIRHTWARNKMYQCLHAWHVYSLHRKQREIDKFWKQKLEEISDKLVSKYEAELQQVRGELQECKDILKVKEAQAMYVEDDFKKAFMRGVCALNMEAVSALKPPPKLTDDLLGTTSNNAIPVALQPPLLHTQAPIANTTNNRTRSTNGKATGM